MLLDYESLKLVWWALIVVLWIGFALTDGFDFGIGALLPFVGKTDVERRVMINTIAPHWDGNQVWLILAAGALFAAWPLVYGAAFSGFYFAMLIVLFALFFRPVGFDYRSKLENSRWRNAWDISLSYAGIVPPFIFGVAVGNLFLGVPLHYDEYLRAYFDGGFFSLLRPFALVSGLLGVAMLTMHGAAYLMVRTSPDEMVHKRARNYLSLLAIAVFVLFALEGVWLWLGIDGLQITSAIDGNAQPNPTTKQVSLVAGAWLNNYSIYPLTILAPVMGLLGAFGAFIMARAKKPGMALLNTSISVIGIICTAAFSLFPFIMPSSVNPSHSLTLWDATSSHLTLNIMLIATAIFLPTLIGYTIWCYRALWGKITEEFIGDNDHSLY